jgi:hypothetical protein
MSGEPPAGWVREKMRPTGAKAWAIFAGLFGTTDVMPCYKARLKSSFSASCDAVP